MKKAFLLFATLVWAATTPSFAVNISDNLKATIEGVVNQPSAIRFTLENISPDLTIRFVRWHTPLEEEITKDIFLVKLNGVVQPYLGRVVRRRPPNNSDYITLTPGEKLAQTIDLSSAYDLSKSGTYSVQFRSNLLDVEVVGAIKRTANKSLNSERIQSSSIQISISEAHKKIIPSIITERASFSSCNTIQTNQIQAAHNSAKNLATESKEALVNASASSRSSAARYKKWFGTYTNARYQRVMDSFIKISSAIDTQNIQYFCDCSVADELRGVIAYVYINQPYEIHICNNTFLLGTSGSDTQAGTVIHELSHFTILGGTDDHVYGYANSLALALNSPANAVDNAENYLFFAENIPALSNGKPENVVISPILQLLL